MAHDIHIDTLKPQIGHEHPTLPLPQIGDVSDWALSSARSLENVSIPPPDKAFFPPCRRNLLTPILDLEEGHSRNASRITDATLVGDETDKSNTSAEHKKRPIAYHHVFQATNSGNLPRKKGFKLYRSLRWNYGSVYRRLFCLAVLGNVAAITWVLLHHGWTDRRIKVHAAVNAAAANILIALLARNEHVINALFMVFASWPKRLPLSIRRVLAKVYCYGGIHSGCSAAATLWYVVYLVLVTRDFSSSNLTVLRGYSYLVSYAVIFLLCLIIVFALPGVRIRVHNWFEGTHRFLGWAVILLLWVQIGLMAADVASASHVPYARVVAEIPAVWILLAVTLLVVYPWTRLRLRDVKAEVLSDHCVKLNFKYADVHYGQAVRLTDAPLRETHAFAAIPNTAAPSTFVPEQLPSSHRAYLCADISCQRKSTLLPTTHLTGKHKTSTLPLYNNLKGFSVIVSNAGDWTQKIIHNTPSKIYSRGVPQYGVLRIAGLFSPVIIVATGSGIGPCLSLFIQKPDHPVRIIWSAHCPVRTYGQGIVDMIYRADPDAVVIDTEVMGRVDLVALAYRMWESSLDDDSRRDILGAAGRVGGRSEAVVVISNQTVTRKVVYGLETRGVPAYGAVFDS